MKNKKMLIVIFVLGLLVGLFCVSPLVRYISSLL